MDRSRVLAYTMIDTALTKGLRDIQDNLYRGLRNLVDLGSYFARDQEQRGFFRKAHARLKDSRSSYFPMAKHVLNTTDHRILKRVTINLGYNGGIYGARIIRQNAASTGYALPPSLLFNFQGQLLPLPLLEQVITAGEEQGIYSSLLWVEAKPRELEDLVLTLQDFSDHAFFLFSSPTSITPTLAALVRRAQNIALVLPYSVETHGQCLRTAKVLLENKCLFGTSVSYDNNSLSTILDPNLQKQLRIIQGSFACFQREGNLGPLSRIALEEFLDQARSSRGSSIFLVDLRQDLENLAHKLHPQTQYFTIDHSGNIGKAWANTKLGGLNIKSHSLPAIAQAVASYPK